MEAGIIINPYAGTLRSGDIERCIRLARTALDKCALDGEVVRTTGIGTARELARSMVASGASTLVAWGGDGTVNEVAAEVAFRSVVLGIVPGGSGNGLARELRLERRPETALLTALQGVERVLDVGEIGGKLFVNVAGLGFDAHLAEMFNTSSHRGRTAYFMMTLRALLAYRPSAYTVRAEGETFHDTALLVSIANGRQYGSGARIAPLARVDDGLLDVVFVGARSPWSVLSQAWRLFNGTVYRLKGVRTLSVQRAELAAPRPLTFHVDGEVFTGGTCLKVRVHPHALRVRVAKHTGLHFRRLCC